MIDPREHLEEYVDGLLDASEQRVVETALAQDADLRAELERVRRFGVMLEELPAHAATQFLGASGLLGATGTPSKGATSNSHRSQNLFFPLFAAAAAAALMLWITGPAPREDQRDEGVVAEIQADWATFGQRLARIAQERRDGHLPRLGLGDLEVPPAKAFGIVYAAGLDELGVNLQSGMRARARDLVQAHFVALRNLPAGVEGEYRRSKGSLRLYRSLRNEAGRDAADAYYDLFRPGLVNRETVVRLEAGSLERVLRNRAEYVAAYDVALRQMTRRYGAEMVAVVMDRLAPADSRDDRWDASQDGANPDAVLSIRTELYRVALENGSDRLYVDVG